MDYLLHERALKLAKQYLDSERHLVEVLEEIDAKKIWRSLGHSSFFEYVTKALGLTESQAYTLTSVSRKCREIPELKRAIMEERVSISNAKRILPVLNQEDSGVWLAKAETLSTRMLEKEVAVVSPRTLVREEIKPVTKDLSTITLCIDDQTEVLFRKAQDLLSKKAKKNLSFEETVKTMSELVIEKLDPVRRAERAVYATKREMAQEAPSGDRDRIGRGPLPAAVLYQVFLRDRGRCQAKNLRGESCENSRFIELHHRVPLSKGGIHHVNNLTTLCSAHHKQRHVQ